MAARASLGRLVLWFAAANAVALALAVMPSGEAAAAGVEGVRNALAWCGIG